MRRPRLSYANVMATGAMFVALGGSSYAVTQLPRNSVGERQLKSNAVTGAKIRDSSVGRVELAPDALVAGPRGPRGAEGQRGDRGDSGAPGAPGATGPRGPSTALVKAVTSGTALPRSKNQLATVAALPSVPAGSYLVTFTAQSAWFGSGGLIAYCSLRRDGQPIGYTAAVVGGLSGSVRAAPLTDTVPVSTTSPFRLSVECGNDQDVPGDQPTVGINGARLTALQVESIQEAP